MEQLFPKFPEKRTTLRGIPKFSKLFFPEIFFPFNFASRISRIFCEWFAYRKFNNLRISGNVSENCSPFAAVSKFSKVLVEWAKVSDRARVQVWFISHFSFSHSPFHFYNIRGFLMQSVSALICKTYVYPHYCRQKRWSQCVAFLCRSGFC